jgi:hypothetical protein
VTDAATTAEDTAVAVAVLANDADVDGDALAVTAVTQGANGAVTFTAGGVTYAPAANFFGTDSFTYTVSDGHGGTATGTVSVTVNPVNDAPTLDAITNRTIAEDAGTQTVSLSGITAGPGESQALTVTAVSDNPARIPNPTVTYTSPGSAGTLTFTPAADANGTATFTVTVSDGQTTTTRQFTVTVTAVNDAPTLDPLADRTIDEDAGTQTVILSGITAGPPDESQGLTVTATSSNPNLIPTPGVSYTNPGATGTLTFFPATNGNGSAVITVTVSDGQTTTSRSFTVTVTPVNDPPLAANDTATTNEDTAATVAVLGNDFDIDRDTLSVAAVTQGAHGAVAFTASGVTYTPAANYNGADSFTYTVSDGHGGSATATVSVTVDPVNDAPAAAAETATTAEDTAVAVAVLANDTDVDGDALAVTAVTQGANGAVTFTAGGVTYAPAANFFGTDSFTYTVSDGHGGTAAATVSVTVNAVNDPPTLAALTNLTVDEDSGTQTVTLSGITAGPNESQTLTVTATSSNPGLIPNPTVTYTSPNATGTLSFAPAANASGSAVVTVTVTDGGGGTVSRQFTVTVTAVNDAPSFAAGANQTVTAGSGPQAVGGWATNVSPGPADEAGQGLAFVVTTTNPGLFVAAPAVDPATGTLTFIPEAGAAGTATVTVVLQDSGGAASASQTFTITVAPDGLPTTPGVRMVGTELVITGANTNDTVTVLQQGANAVKVNATLNGRQYKNQSFSGVTLIRVDAGGGNDTVDLDGVNTLPTWTDAGAGDDTVTGGGGDDVIYLGAGEDVADAGAGDDFVAGGDDNDLVIGGPGVDQLFGQAGNDILVGGSAAAPARKDSLRKVLADWNPASTGTGGYANVRSRLAVADDGVADQLTGGAGTDWFWEPIFVAPVDLEPGEQQN